MKIKTFLILVSILLTSKQFCQEYESVIKEGSFWDIKTTVFASSCSSSDIESIKRIQIAGDTIINNMTYKKLKSAFLQDDNDTDPCFIPPLYVNENNFTPIEDCYLRENINERKLYILTNSITVNTLEEYTVCDFSLNIGDKIDNYFGFNNNEVGNELIVDDIKLDENNRKVFYLNDGSYYTEAIGRNEGNLNIYFNLVDGTYETLYCFGNALNQNNCATVLSIEKNELSSLKIFPNPVDDFLMIKNTDDITIKIYSLNGSLLKTVKTKSNLEIDVSSFSSGIYILEFLNYNSKSRGKIIKL